MPQRSGARFIAETLKGYGVTHVFYMLAILRKTLVEMEDLGIQRILTHSEKSAAYMADGYARISGKPGVCMAQSVGAANLAAGLQDPYLAHSPVIALTGRKQPTAQYRNAYQEVIHAPLYESVTKFDANLDMVEQLPVLLAQAFREATAGAPRPVHLDLLGLSGEVIESAAIESAVNVDGRFSSAPAIRPEPEPGFVKQAAGLLEQSEKPVIVAGRGAVISSAGPEVMALAERLSIPVATSNDGKGIIVETHPLSVGVVGSYSCRSANQVVLEADLVIYVGCSVSDQVTLDWTIPAPGTRIIQIDIDPCQLGRSYGNTLGIMGDAKVSVAKLMSCITSDKRYDKWTARVQQTVQEWKDTIAPMRNSDAVPIRPERLCRALTEILPTNAVLVADTGYSAVWSSTMIHTTNPNQQYIRAAGSLGWAFPASLGAKCAAPERPVLCFTGDGGFWYHIGELETARRFGIHTVTVVNNNNALAQSITGMRNAYGDRPGKREETYVFAPTDFAKIAEAMGCAGIRVESPDEIRPALEQALTADAPVVVDVLTDRNCDPPATWSPK